MAYAVQASPFPVIGLLKGNPCKGTPEGLQSMGQLLSS